MTLTLHSSWTAEADQARCRPVFLVTVWTASATSEKLLSAKSSTMDYPVSVLSVTPTSRSMDLETRRLSTGSVSIRLRADSVTDYMIDTYVLRGTRCEIAIGFADVAEANFAAYFVGIIDEIVPSPNDVLITVKDARSKLAGRNVHGSWTAKHPLEIIDSLLGVQLTSDMVDSTAFDPDTYNTSISHWIADLSSADFQGERAVTSPTAVTQLIDELAGMLDGAVHVTEAGLYTFSRFDSSAASDDDWTTRDLIGDPPIVVETLYGNLVNRVIAQGVPLARNMDGLSKGQVRNWYIDEDTDSQARYKYFHSGGGNDYISEAKITLPWAAAIGMTDFDDGASIVVTSKRAYAFCGARATMGDLGVYPTIPSWAPLSATRTSYVKIDDEIIECNASAIDKALVRNVAVLDPTMGTSRYTYQGVLERLTLTVATRGALDTSSVAHGSAMKQVLDITVPVAIARARLERFANGAPIIRTRTNMSKYALQIGDFVTVTCPKEIYRSWGKSGLGTDTKWEIIGKKCDIHSDAPGIEWTLAYAAETSPPAFTYAQEFAWMQRLRELGDRMVRGAESDSVGIKTVTDGFSLTENGGLSVTIGTGTASNLSFQGELDDAATRDVVYDEDTWISFDIESESIVYRAYTKPSSEPNTSNTEVMLWKVVATLGVITSTTDLRTINQGIDTRSLAGEAVQPGKIYYATEVASLQPNSEFTAWSSPFNDKDTYRPDHWTLTDSATPWLSALGGNSYRMFHTTSNSRTGDTSIELENDGAWPTSSWYGLETTDFIPCSEGLLYLLQASWYVSQTNQKVRLTYRFYDKDKVWITDRATIIAGSGAKAWITHKFYRRAFPTAAYMKIKFSVSRNTGGAGDTAYIDYLRVVRAPASFSAYSTANLTLTAGGAGTWQTVSNKAEFFDLGKDFDHATNFYFVANEPGYWQFTAKAHFNAVPAADEVGVRLTLNGNEIGTHSQTNGTASARDMHLNVSSSVAIAAGDIVRQQVIWQNLPAGAGPVVVWGSSSSGSLYSTYISGTEKKEI